MQNNERGGYQKQFDEVLPVNGTQVTLTLLRTGKNILLHDAKYPLPLTITTK